MDYIDNQNDFIRNFLGITAWHKAGYRGKRGLSATAEDFEHSAKSAHAYKTYAVVKEIAPDREVIYLPPLGNSDSTFMSEQIQTMIDRGVDTWFCSLAFPINGADVNKAFDRLTNTTLFVAAGNYETNRITSANNLISVGAFYLENGVPTPEPCSAESTNVDFSGIENFIIDGELFFRTSCATPSLCGQAALVNDFFIDKTGKPLSSAMMYQFLKDHSHDFYESGKDTKTGWGYVKLPDPETIDIGRYAPLEITMQIGSNKMTVNGETKVLDQAPIIAQSGRTLAPVRAVFEAAGLTVSWNADTQTITATR